MREREPMTQTMKASQARQEFSQVLNRVYRKEARVIVEKSGIPVAAIISAQDFAHLTRLEAQRAERFTVIDAMRDAFADVSDDTLEREVDKALTQVRAENAGAARGARARK